MQYFEHKFPPPFVMFTIAGIMVFLNWLSPQESAETNVNEMIAGGIILIGIITCLAGVYGFKSAQTTMNPFRPETATVLVTNGIYNFSRNPMYLGFALILTGLFINFDNQWLIIGPIGFVLYMNRFQIQPEELAMQKIFGDDYLNYCKKVRRWI